MPNDYFGFWESLQTVSTLNAVLVTVMRPPYSSNSPLSMAGTECCRDSLSSTRTCIKLVHFPSHHLLRVSLGIKLHYVLVAQSCLTLCDPITVPCQASLSVGFSRQEYWSGLPFHSPGDLLDPGIEPRSPILQADSLQFEPPGKPKKKGFPDQELDRAMALRAPNPNH